MDKKNEAKKLLKHYFRLAVKAAGGKWDYDNDAEIDTLVDYLIDAAVRDALSCIPASTLE
jgi:hypothetical protein